MQKLFKGRPPMTKGASPGSIAHLVKTLSTVLAVLAVTACGQLESKPETFRSLPDNYVRGSFVISVDPDTDPSAVGELAEQVGQKQGCQVQPPEAILWEDTSGVVPADMAGQYNLAFEDCDLSESGTSAILDQLAASASVTSAQAEALATQGPLLENDPDKALQGFLSTIRRDEACQASQSARRPIVVAVLDSGVDPDHPDLQEAFLRDEAGAIVGANFVGSRARAPHDRQFDDGTGHGTHVAGLIAAASNNNQGGVGVASCVDVKIIPVRVLNNEGSGSSIEIERGVRWAAEQGADIINLSLGYTARYRGRPSNFRSPLYASLARRNIVVFAAAGNEGYINGGLEDDGRTRFHFPSSYDDVIAVAATNNQGELTGFSNRGERVDVAAPGYRLYSTVPGSYQAKSGTSMATPVVSGIYALALASVADGLEFGGRMNRSAVDELLAGSTSDSFRLRRVDVTARGVLDAKSLIENTQARFGGSTEPSSDEPERETEPQFSEPQLEPETANFAFAGLQDGDQAALPQGISIKGVPKKARYLYFFWGNRGTPFSATLVPEIAAADQVLSHPSRFFFRGEGQLKAITLDATGQVLAETAIDLKGF